MERKHFEEYKKLGLNIAYYRKEQGLSQIQLADKIDISRTHMSRIENNDCAVSLDVIFSIAKALNIPVAKLFEFRQNMLQKKYLHGGLESENEFIRK